MTTLRAHFDGRVLIPDEPVELPRNCTLEIDVRRADTADRTESVDSSRMTERDGHPIIKVSPNAPSITLEDARRAEEEN